MTQINQSDLLKELSYWHHKTDDECVALATSEDGTIDYKQALLNIMVRNRCVSINNRIVSSLGLSELNK
jgi:hypothetical protein